jgi:hypothetical protein
MSTTPASTLDRPPVDGPADRVGYDFGARVDALRCHSTKALRAAVADARREQQRWYLEELAATRVLDDRHMLDVLPDASVSARTAKTNREVARSLESLPKVAAAAWDGTLSKDQLVPVSEVATPASDAEWARRGQRATPVDLQRQARATRTVSAADTEARRAARYVTSWRDAAQGMVFGRWALPDVDGVLVEKVLDHMAERIRPAKGMAWDSLAHRKADAFVELAHSYADVQPTGRFRVEIVEITDRRGTVTRDVDGIPVAPETITALRPNAKVREAVLDRAGTHTTRRPRTGFSVDVERHVRRRDPHCRVPGCEATRGLQIHHCRPVCEHGDSQDTSELAAVCPPHHQILEPHGPYQLIGDAEDPQGLTLIHRDDRPRDGPAP